MSDADSKKDSGKDSGTDTLIIIGVFIVALFAGAYFLELPIKKALIYLDMYKNNFLYNLLDDFHYRKIAINESFILMHEDRVRNIPLSLIYGKTWYLFLPLTLPLFLYVLYQSGFIYIGKMVKRYSSAPGAKEDTKKYTARIIDRIIRDNAQVFPEMRPVVGMQSYLLNTKNMFVGPWRMQDDFITFALKNKLIYDKCSYEKQVNEIELKRKLALQDGQNFQGLSDEEKNKIKEDTYYDMKKAGAVIAHKRRYNINDVVEGDEKNLELKIDFKYFDNDYTQKCAILDRKRAEKVFLKQLGFKYHPGGVLSDEESEKVLENLLINMPNQHKALMAAFIIHVFHKDKAIDLFDQYNNSFAYKYDEEGEAGIYFSPNEIDMTYVDDILYNYVLGRPVLSDEFPYPTAKEHEVHQVKEKILSFTYINPLMVGLIAWARETNIVLSSSFIWLRPMDRTLWASMNNAGRENEKNTTSHSECAGVFAHYLIESTLGFAIGSPAIEEAVYALEYGLYQEGWVSYSQRAQEQEEKSDMVSSLMNAIEKKGKENTKNSFLKRRKKGS